MAGGSFLISLDFELFWGMRDKTTLAAYGANILGVRAAIPAMLSLFRRYQIHATWAAVGMLLFDSRRELLRYLPERRPNYKDPELIPYGALQSMGDDERQDPYHYGLSLVRRILDCEGMELGSHTFSHYYCLEPGQTAADFAADLEAAVAATGRLGVRPVSLVFPRNQCHSAYLGICAAAGFRSYRGNPSARPYRAVSEAEQQGCWRRAAQLLDTYVNAFGAHSFAAGAAEPIRDLPASRFLRPCQPRRRVLEPLRLHRIRGALTAAAETGRSFHLWWHPHNFGANLAANLEFLENILQHFARLRERHGMVSHTMAEAAAAGRLEVAA